MSANVAVETNDPLLGHGEKIAALAAGRALYKTIRGKRQAYADITFTGQPSAGDTFNINGTTFTARASGASGNEFNISGANLSGTIDNMVTVLNASAVAGVAVATYSNVGGTKLHVVFDAYGTVGNAFTLAEASANASVVAPTLFNGVDADPIKLKHKVYALVTNAGATPCEFDLPAGDEGQEITLYLNTKGSSSNAKVNGAFVGGTALTFDTAGKMVKLQFLNASWAPIANTGSLA